MRIEAKEMHSIFFKILVNHGVPKEYAGDWAQIFVDNSLVGVYSHGINRFKKIIEYIDKGLINIHEQCTCEVKIGNIERWNGHCGIGPLNAQKAVLRACKLAKEQGIGIVALGNNNHWLRGGYYGSLAADQGCICICWSNTKPNMQAWGSKDTNIGNNPIVFAVPDISKEHIILDCAVSQFSYGKIEECMLKNIELPVPGGLDEKGEPTRDPSIIYQTKRVLPMGYWKGSGLSILLDLIGTILSNGNSVMKIGTFEREIGLTQIFIVIDPLKFINIERMDQIVHDLKKSLKDSHPIQERREVYYPGELETKVRKENLKKGLPVIEAKWKEILNLL